MLVRNYTFSKLVYSVLFAAIFFSKSQLHAQSVWDGYAIAAIKTDVVDATVGVSNVTPTRAKMAREPISIAGIPNQIGGSRWVTPMLTIKTNLTELATTTLNIGVEQFIGDRLSVSVPVSYNPWTFAHNKKIKHLAIQPEFRVWFGESFRGSFINVQSFIGLQLHYLYYNAGGINIPFGMFPDPKNTRYQGQGAGGGVTYANQFGLGGRWRGEIGTTLAFSYLWYDSYECKTCGAFKESGTRRYIGPGKSSLSIVYLTAIYALY